MNPSAVAEVRCPMCQTTVDTDFPLLTAKRGEPEIEFRLLRCDGCGLGWVVPPIPPHVLPDLYPPAYRTAQGTDSTASTSYGDVKLKVARARFSRNALYRFSAALLELAIGRRTPVTLGVPLQLSSEAVILDVGCGAGNWLMAMHRLGYRNLAGVDFDDSCANRLQERGISFSCGALEQVRLTQSHYDLIRMEHVLEHVADPKLTLRYLYSLLKPGGTLVIGVPNFASLSARIAGTSWNALEFPRHTFQFTPKSLVKLCLDTGLSVSRFQHLPILEQLTKSFSKRNDGHRKGHILWQKGLAPLWAILVTTLRMGDYISVELKKRP